MNPTIFTFPLIPKSKIIRQRILIGIVIGIFVLALIAGYFWFQKMGREIDWKVWLGKITLFPEEKEKAPEEVLPEEVLPEELKITLPATPKVYEEIAELGEGITHLARKALKSYLVEKETDLELTAEHKIYIEDYLQKKTGDRWLNLGEKVTFSEELIAEAINMAQQLTPEQLENLQQYSALVPSF